MFSPPSLSKHLTILLASLRSFYFIRCPVSSVIKTDVLEQHKKSREKSTTTTTTTKNNTVETNITVNSIDQPTIHELSPPAHSPTRQRQTKKLQHTSYSSAPHAGGADSSVRQGPITLLIATAGFPSRPGSLSSDFS